MYIEGIYSHKTEFQESKANIKYLIFVFHLRTEIF